MHYFNAFTIRFNDRLYRLHAFSPSVSVEFISSPDRVSKLSCWELRAHENSGKKSEQGERMRLEREKDGKIC
jgi:hypothetical protein